MLKRVFLSEPLKYEVPGENISSTSGATGSTFGMFCAAFPTRYSPHTIYVAVQEAMSQWPQYFRQLVMWDATSGDYLGRIDTFGVPFFGVNYAFRSRWGKTYWGTIHRYIVEFDLSGQTNVWGTPISITEFDPSLGGFGCCQLDETTDTMITTDGFDLYVNTFSTRALRSSIRMPESIIATCLEDDNHVYALCANRVLVLIDFIRGEVLGATKVPPASTAGTEEVAPPAPLGAGRAGISWDYLSRRLLVFEITDNAPNGDCTSRISGYRMVPVAVRITTPVPLRVPRVGRTIPVMTQVLGDMNEGVSGYVITSVVTGGGSLANLPITDNHGQSLTQVSCNSAIDCTVVCTATLPGDPGSWSRPTDPTPTPGTPGGSPSQGGPTAPNGMQTMQSVYNSQTWRLQEAFEDMPDGRGAFTEAVVTALHAIDAGFGHIKKKPGHNQYNGHAVDALMYKRPDGSACEVYDIVTGSGNLCWRFVSAKASNCSNWYYPA